MTVGLVLLTGMAETADIHQAGGKPAQPMV